jgi:hypothetical protein
MPIAGTNIPKYQNQPAISQGRFRQTAKTAPEMTASSRNASPISQNG